MDDMNEIVICPHCRKPEYYGEMRWLNGFCGCRSCYKKFFELNYNTRYLFDDLDGNRPTMEDYNKQNDLKGGN